MQHAGRSREAAAAANGVFLEIREVPVHVGVLWPSAGAARDCGRGDIRLRFERESGFIHNAAFEASRVDYSLRYDNALHFSPFFQAFEERLARRLIERYGIRAKDIVEVGAGGGRFLGLLCELGGNRGTGYDPSHDAAAADARLSERVRVVRDYYSDRHADQPADLVVCRHVLEHVPDPRAMLRTIRNALDARPAAVLYFEVPNSYYILRDLSIWDIIYEHCGYFVPESLAAMFEDCGFEILDLHETYEGQFVGIEARIAPAGASRTPRDLEPLARCISDFRGRFGAKRDAWQQRLEALRREGKRCVVWGAGAKAVSFLNLLEIGHQIEYAVDINPGKQGSYLAGSGQEIVAPAFLAEYRPDVAIVMNPAYEREIAEQLAALCPATQTLCA